MFFIQDIRILDSRTRARAPRRIPAGAAGRLLALCAAGLLLLSCQSPTETPPELPRSVVVQVQDAAGTPLEQVPVEMHAMEGGALRLLDTEVTGRDGNALFAVVIPSTGRAFRFVAGGAATGTAFVDANLLCRDTLVVVRLASELLPCGETVDRTLRIDDICAPLRTGERFTDSVQYTFTSTCDEVLTFTIGGAVAPEVRLVLLDAQGRAIADRPFQIPPRGQFTVRAVVTPADSGQRSHRYTFTGTGANGASATLNLTIEIDARNCNVCECPAGEIIVDFGYVEASPQQRQATRTVDLPANLCSFVREDNIVKNVTQPQRFGVPPISREMVASGGRYARTLTFVPAPGDYSLVEDTLLVEHWIAAEGKACTTRVILRGQGCGPECRLVEGGLVPTGANSWEREPERVRVYESGGGRLCVENAGDCGELRVSASAVETPGFTLSPREVVVGPGETGCFEVRFIASDQVVWPDGHGQPAKVEHLLPVSIRNCGALKTVTVPVRVDTIPVRFSRCIYQWDQNGNYGYNFTPVEGKGEDHFDPLAMTAQESDLVVTDCLPGLSADVLFRGGWKEIKTNVSETQFNFTDMSTATNGWSSGEYRSITTGAFNPPGAATLEFRGVYSVQIVRNGTVTYACVRVREVSVDPDGKFKLCLDVLYPMIKE